MVITHTPDTLRAFTQRVAEAFNSGIIRAPVHLSGGNEEQLLDVFQTIEPDDWIACSWRSHYHCLLKGVPEDELFAAILAGRSIGLCFSDYRIISSGIVGGTLPIALGLAWAIKRQGGNNRAHVFVGDGTCETGIFLETFSYAVSHDLPLSAVVERNGKSVCTPISAMWGLPENDVRILYRKQSNCKLQDYAYELPWPHSGAGKRIQF